MKKIVRMMYQKNKRDFSKGIIIYPTLTMIFTVSLIYFYAYLVSLNNVIFILMYALFFLGLFAYCYGKSVYYDVTISVQNKSYLKKMLISNIVMSSEESLTGFSSGMYTEAYQKIDQLVDAPKVVYNIYLCYIEITLFLCSIFYFFGIKIVLLNLLIVPLFLFLRQSINRLLQKKSHLLRSGAATNTTMGDIINNVSIVQNYDVGTNFMNQIKKGNCHYQEKYRSYQSMEAMLTLLSRFLNIFVALISMVSVILFSDNYSTSLLIPASFVSVMLAQSVSKLFDYDKAKKQLQVIIHEFPIFQTTPTNQRSELSVNQSSNLLVENVSYTYPETTHPTFKQITIEFSRQGLYLIIGSSGEGKSTLLKCLSGLNTNYDGKITYFSDNLCYVAQESSLLAISTTENILLGSQKGEIDYFGSKYLEDFIPKETPAHKLSGGQRQAINVLRALNASPDILILDEPFSSQHELLRKELFNVLSNYSKTKLVIIATHDEDIINYSDNILELRNGEVIKKSNEKNI